MIQRKPLSTALLTVMTSMFVGCMPKMDIETLKQMMPPRAAELDRLDTWVGQWTHEGEMTMAMLDKPLHTTGSSTINWDLDKRMLVEHAEYNMEELGPMKGIGIWSWDPAIKKYRIWWFDSFGDAAAGTARYHESTETWHMKTWSKKHGHHVLGKGTVRMIDPDTMEWTWGEYGFFGLMEIAEMKGVSKRQ